MELYQDPNVWNFYHHPSGKKDLQKGSFKIKNLSHLGQIQFGGCASNHNNVRLRVNHIWAGSEFPKHGLAINKIGWIGNDICPSVCTNKITTLLRWYQVVILKTFEIDFMWRCLLFRYWSWPSKCSELLRWTLLDSVCCSDIEIMSFSCNLILVFVTSGYWWVSDD